MTDTEEKITGQVRTRPVKRVSGFVRVFRPGQAVGKEHRLKRQ
jgi:hypothetical protein